MKADQLRPAPMHFEGFRRDRHRHIPEASGNYVLTRIDNTILYVGLTKNLRKRFLQHLDRPEKISPTVHGRAVLFHWLESADTCSVERGWIFMHCNQEGARPVLNKADSPLGQ